MKGDVNRVVSLALTALVLAACPPASAGPLPIEPIPPASGELTALADLVVMLRHELDGAERHLDGQCDAVEIRDHFLNVRNRALDAVNRLGSLWQTGRLRSGALAASEGLTRDLVVLIYEAHDAAALAHALAELGDAARRAPKVSPGTRHGTDAGTRSCVSRPFASGDHRR